MKIKLNTTVLVGSKTYYEGDEPEVPGDISKETAESIIDQGLGSALEPPKRAKSAKSSSAESAPASKGK